MKAGIRIMLICILILTFCSLLTDGCAIPEPYVRPNPPGTPFNPPKPLRTMQEINDERREQYFNDHPELSEQIKQCIRKGTIVLGMTKEQVTASWGKPDDIHRSVYSFGVHEQWIYGDRQYLYFEDGILTSWQD